MAFEWIDTDTISSIKAFIVAGALSAFGGTAAYIYRCVKCEKAFSLSMFFVNVFLAFFVGNAVGDFIPADIEYRDGIMMIIGFSSWPILDIMQVKGKYFFEKFVR